MNNSPFKTTYLTKCHDSTCVQAPLCWRYNARHSVYAVYNAPTLRQSGEENCQHFVQDENIDPRDEPR